MSTADDYVSIAPPTPQQREAWTEHFTSTEETRKPLDTTFTPEQEATVPIEIDGMPLTHDERWVLLVHDGYVPYFEDGSEHQNNPNYNSHYYTNLNGHLKRIDTSNKEVYVLKSEVKTNNSLTIKNNSIMNTKNVDYLKDQMKYLGFGESLHQPLTTAIENGHERFSLKLVSDAATAQGNTAKFELFFNKSKDSDMYFFNTYKTELTDKNGNEYKSNSFSVDGTKSITAKESINLLEGRSVKTVFNFNGENTELFAKIDFANKTEKGNYKFHFYNKNYGVDVKEILGKSHIVFADNKENENLVKSLEKGNLVPSKFILKGAETTGFVSLNAQYKTLDYFTDDLKPVYTKNLGQGQGPEENKTTSKQVDPDANPLLSKEENELTEALLDDIENGKGIGKKNESEAVEEAQEKSNGRRR